MMSNHKGNESQTYENSFGPVTLSLEELYKSSDSAVVSPEGVVCHSAAYPAVVPQWFRTASAVDLRFFRSGSALLPQWICTSSAVVLYFFRSGSAVVPHCFRSGSSLLIRSGSSLLPQWFLTADPPLPGSRSASFPGCWSGFRQASSS